MYPHQGVLTGGNLGGAEGIRTLTPSMRTERCTVHVGWQTAFAQVGGVVVPTVTASDRSIPRLTAPAPLQPAPAEFIMPGAAAASGFGTRWPLALLQDQR